MPDLKPWVVDTSMFTHLFRAGHGELLQQLSPGGSVLLPVDVAAEVERGRDSYVGIPDVTKVAWVRTTVLSDIEMLTHIQVNVALGGDGIRHLGESAVIAIARHRHSLALLDDRAAATQADLMGVEHRGTLWVVVEAFKTIFERDRSRAEAVVDDLLASDMYLPISSGSSLFSWAYGEGLLP